MFLHPLQGGQLVFQAEIEGTSICRFPSLWKSKWTELIVECHIYDWGSLLEGIVFDTIQRGRHALDLCCEQQLHCRYMMRMLRLIKL
jgi:hypothetical protein